MEIIKLETESISQFSERDRAYLNNSKVFSDFLETEFSKSSFPQLISNRKSFRTDRQLLVSTLKKQYDKVSACSITQANIEALLQEDTFTVTTAHQPSLFTGPLYYIYKILSTINLSNQLNDELPQTIVPVFVIGGEDHDFEEINHFHVFGKSVEWHSDNSGPVGRFSLTGIDTVFDQLRDIFPNNDLIAGFLDTLADISEKCDNYSEFSFRLTHTLFDKYGLVILRMDEPAFKSAFTHIIKDDIINHTSKELVEETQSRLDKMGFKPQAYVRDINLFYTGDDMRQRIEKVGETFQVVDTHIKFTGDELTNEIEQHPEHFSPNVILRPLFQELILPNLAYIGGGGELAYWMERLSQFRHYKIPFPMLIRRNSGLILKESDVKQINKLGFEPVDMFLPIEQLILEYIKKSGAEDYNLQRYKSDFNQIFEDINNKVRTIDQTLLGTSKSELSKIHKSLDYLQGKLKKSLKNQEEIQINRIKKLKDKLFPAGLQERYDNILEYIALYGFDLLDQLLPHCDPFDKKFIVFLMQPSDRPANKGDLTASP